MNTKYIKILIISSVCSLIAIIGGLLFYLIYKNCFTENPKLDENKNVNNTKPKLQSYYDKLRENIDVFLATKSSEVYKKIFDAIKEKGEYIQVFCEIDENNGNRQIILNIFSSKNSKTDDEVKKILDNYKSKKITVREKSILRMEYFNNNLVNLVLKDEKNNILEKIVEILTKLINEIEKSGENQNENILDSRGFTLLDAFLFFKNHLTSLQENNSKYPYRIIYFLNNERLDILEQHNKEQSDDFFDSQKLEHKVFFKEKGEYTLKTYEIIAFIFSQILKHFGDHSSIKVEAFS
ncbi:hypothetical protein EDEG_01690 [Edhazardia aedis USNM 41457]|uniref:Uncharacterized protein n=1 Tax=Edhazardia aedis (strain USNM 41457) TaxID=1003232 RepID=J9DRS1_EDHAE|nr:hypothetical protein EDEG_01690 [Edhazardia aedis USNM 41457]|eukprot:EJW04017.1 hypothetical protein EDEG_01690 [Edhazardia aedis USNM 41457]